MPKGEKDELVTLVEYWTLARRDGGCGPRVKRIQIAAVEVERVPATMTVELELGGSR
jgi:hypothetical protein